MKKYLIIFIFATLLIITGCNSDSQTTTSTSTTTPNETTTVTNSTEETTTTREETTTTTAYTVDYDQSPIIDDVNCVEDGTSLDYKGKKCSFSLMVLPDTQMYTESNRIAEAFYSQTKWIAENYRKYNIKLTAHLGDIVNTAHNVQQWSIADKAFDILDNGSIPYGVTAGNHDFRGLSKDTSFYLWYDNERSTMEHYLKYFSKERTSQVTENYGGHSENGWNSYYYFEGYGNPYMVLFVDFAPSEGTVAWANQILNENQNIPTIVITHNLVKPIGSSANFNEPETVEFWENIVYENNQVFMVVNGHYKGQGYTIKQNKDGNDVILIVVDYQGDYNGGNGMLRLIEFDEVNNLITNRSFSPYVLSIPEEERSLIYDKVEIIDAGNKFMIPWNFSERFSFRDNN